MQRGNPVEENLLARQINFLSIQPGSPVETNFFSWLNKFSVATRQKNSMRRHEREANVSTEIRDSRSLTFAATNNKRKVH